MEAPKEQITFIGGYIMYIPTRGMNRQQEAEIFDYISSELGKDIPHEFYDDSLYLSDGEYSPEDVVDFISKIVEYLDDLGVSWKPGYKVAFSYRNEIGFIIIKRDSAIIGYIDDNGKVNKKRIPFADEEL